MKVAGGGGLHAQHAVNNISQTCEEVAHAVLQHIALVGTHPIDRRLRTSYIMWKLRTNSNARCWQVQVRMDNLSPGLHCVSGDGCHKTAPERAQTSRLSGTTASSTNDLVGVTVYSDYCPLIMHQAAPRTRGSRNTHARRRSRRLDGIRQRLCSMNGERQRSAENRASVPEGGTYATVRANTQRNTRGSRRLVLKR